MKIKAQYLSVDALIAAIIFIMLIVSIFSYLKFSIFSQQFYERDVDSTAIYISSLIFAPYNNGYTLLDTSKSGRYLNPSLYNSIGVGSARLTSVVNELDKVTPYETYLSINCQGLGEINPLINYDSYRWVSHIQRAALIEKNGLHYCTIDIFLGVDK